MTIYHILEEALGVPQVIQAAIFTGALLLMAGFAIRRRLATTDGGVIPDEGISVRNICEIIVEGLGKLAHDT
ncbi:MAG: hypothetical protein ACRETX_16635, partial [Steroidobacteraceae bacterium]